jgi:hypothetical protein
MKTIKRTLESFGESVSEWYITSIFVENPIWAIAIFSILKNLVGKIREWLQKPLVKAWISILGIALVLKIFGKILNDKVVFFLALYGLLIWVFNFKTDKDKVKTHTIEN